MALSSTSTRQNAIDQYRDSLNYEDDSSGDTARRMREAIRYLLQEDAMSWSVGGASISRQDLKAELTEVKEFLKALGENAGQGGSRYARIRVGGTGL